MPLRFLAPLAFALAAPAPLAMAEVVSSAADHYVLRHEAVTAEPAADIWARLIAPADWWHPDHTYSGDAGNLSLDPQAGGLWREDWPGGSGAHGTVLAVAEGQVLRLDGAFGPLQSMGVRVVWTITLSHTAAGGTRIVFDEVAAGSSASQRDAIAPAVDRVKSEAIARLAGG